jgi:hypothetical protein
MLAVRRRRCRMPDDWKEKASGLQPRWRRLTLAAAVCLLGMGVFLLLRQLLGDLISDPWLLAGCGIGGFVWPATLYPGRRIGVARGVAVGAGIVWGTFGTIATSYGLGQVVQKQRPMDWTLFNECLTVVGWATFATSWWLLPAVIVVVLGLDTILEAKVAA